MRADVVVPSNMLFKGILVLAQNDVRLIPHNTNTNR